MIDQKLLDELSTTKRQYENATEERVKAETALKEASAAELETYQRFRAAEGAVVEAA